ncbi:hypothetical protein B0H65DRAFT_448791 [Neurospora tetraspora]|uniref:Secreted protein n=1 Tax=Neurospora tetraspora TaxID=94610 RepID=A0AAE0JNQ3_9PEZI|nr:hypothetical protein B0H65DRAFT_448791 [Neurospora tetraspora]
MSQCRVGRWRWWRWWSLAVCLPFRLTLNHARSTVGATTSAPTGTCSDESASLVPRRARQAKLQETCVNKP